MKLLIAGLLGLVPVHCQPAPPASSCEPYRQLVTELSPGWDVDRMLRICHRESRGLAHVRSTTSDTGLFQINDINHRHLRQALGEHVDRWTLQDPRQNVRAAAELFRYWQKVRGDGYWPWKATR